MKARRDEVRDGAPRQLSSATGVAGHVFESRMNVTKTAFCFLSARRGVLALRTLVHMRRSENCQRSRTANVVPMAPITSPPAQQHDSRVSRFRDCRVTARKCIATTEA